MRSRTILITDDEFEVRQALRKILEAEGWQVREAGDAAEMMVEIERGPVDLVTLDLGLGQDCGLDCVHRLRARRNVPVVVITGRGAPFERAQGLAAGVDDYVVKPFDSGEVTIRIRRILERNGTGRLRQTKIRFDHLCVDLRSGQVQRGDGRQEDLTTIEARLLELFLGRPSQILSRDDICRALHGHDWNPFDRSIDVHVARLRRKIEPEGEAPHLIRSVRGVGYVFTADAVPES